jgi:hypothetical protein
MERPNLKVLAPGGIRGCLISADLPFLVEKSATLTERRDKESFLRLAQSCQHAEVLQRGRITGDSCAACDFFQKPSHDLTAARFRQRFSKANFVWLRDCADVRADVIAQFRF